MNELWRVATAVAVLAVTGLSACSKGDSPTSPGGGGGNTTPPPATPVGAYALNSIDTKTMPYMMFSDTGYTLEVSSGSLSVTAAGKWVSKLVSKETVAGNVSTYTDSTFGSWTLGTSTTTANFTNAETGAVSTVSWTATDVTIKDVDGTVTHTILYKRN